MEDKTKYYLNNFEDINNHVYRQLPRIIETSSHLVTANFLLKHYGFDRDRIWISRTEISDKKTFCNKWIIYYNDELVTFVYVIVTNGLDVFTYFTFSDFENVTSVLAEMRQLPGG